MSSLTRREITRLAVALAAGRAWNTIVPAAYRVRAAVRALASAARHLAAVTADTRLPAGLYARYAAECAGAVVLLGSRRAGGTDATHAAHRGDPVPDRVTPDSPSRIELPLAAGVFLLVDRRVRAFQRTVVRTVFRGRFGITPRMHELEVLSSYSSVAWLTRNLLIAAGYGAAAPPAELRHRAMVVYPAFARTLALYRAQLRAEQERFSAERFIVSAHRRRSGARGERGPVSGVIGAGGEFARSLYPDSIVVKRLTTHVELARRRTRAEILRLKNAESLVRLAVYMAAVTLVVQASSRTPRRAARLLGRIGKSER